MKGDSLCGVVDEAESLEIFVWWLSLQHRAANRRQPLQAKVCGLLLGAESPSRHSSAKWGGGEGRGRRLVSQRGLHRLERRCQLPGEAMALVALPCLWPLCLCASVPLFWSLSTRAGRGPLGAGRPAAALRF